jgi:hypothetical protein
MKHPPFGGGDRRRIIFVVIRPPASGVTFSGLYRRKK